MSELRISRRRIIQLALAGGFIGTGGYQYTSRHRLQVRRETLHLPRWRADGLKVAFLSDFHVNAESEVDHSLQAFQTAIEEKPDILLFGGDYLNFNSSLKHVEKWLRELDPGAIPAYAVLGNHDFWSGSIPQLTSLFAASKIKLLRNQVVDVGGATLYGIDDGIEKKDKHDLLSTNQDSGSAIALFHEPDFVDRVDPKVSLMLAGHSHGGQVCWPFGKPAMLPRGARKYWDGFYPNAKVPLFVSRGVGMTGPRVRLFCPPDISILTLRAG